MDFESERFGCRLMTSDDEQQFIALYQDPKVMRKVGQTFTHKQASHAFWQTLKLNNSDELKQRFWAVISKQTHLCVGFVMLKWHLAPCKSTEIGIMLERRANGGKAGLEIVQSLVKFATKDLAINVLVANVNPSHHAAIKILHKTGFRQISEHQNLACFERISKQDSVYSVLLQ